MFKLLLLLKRIHYVLLFLILEVVAVSLFLSSNPYQKARMANLSNIVMGQIYGHISDVNGYFNLTQENDKLRQEVIELRSRLSRIKQVDSLPIPDSLLQPGERYVVVRVIRNSITKRNNFMTINKGLKDGIVPDMALLNQDGIVGYVLTCSENFAIAVSMLNVKDFNTSGKIKGSDFTGSVSWDGLSHRIVQLDEIPKYADMKIGDTIVTTDYSNRFPPDLPIGTITSFEMINGTFYKAQVELFADMGRLKYLYAVEPAGQKEREELEKSYTGEE